MLASLKCNLILVLVLQIIFLLSCGFQRREQMQESGGEEALFSSVPEDRITSEPSRRLTQYKLQVVSHVLN